MKKYYFVSAIVALALASCANDDFLGEVPGNNPSAVNSKAISFSGEAGKMSRANKEERKCSFCPWQSLLGIWNQEYK